MKNRLGIYATRLAQAILERDAVEQPREPRQSDSEVRAMLADAGFVRLPDEDENRNDEPRQSS